MKSPMRLIKTALEYRPTSEQNTVPEGLRGIYALYKKQGHSYNLVYIGMSGKGAKGRIHRRLASHKRNQPTEWTHFSYYEVWDNISDIEIQELEGLFRQLYRYDARSNALNIQQSHSPLVKVRKNTEKNLGRKGITKKSLGLS